MDQRKRLKQAVLSAQRSLNREKYIPYFQRALLLALLASMLIIIASRLFVFPHYIEVAFSVGMAVFLVLLIIGSFKGISMQGAMHRLDAYYPHNELVTVFALGKQDNPLVKSLENKAYQATEQALQAFSERQKQLFLPKVIIGSILTAIVIAILLIFPAATQLEAKVVEQEKETIAELKKEVAALEKKAQTKETKKELQELQKKLATVQTAEEALREVVKKQKELKLQEQKLQNKQLAHKNGENDASGLSAEQLKQLQELGEMTASLAQQSAATQSSLSKLGKPVSFDLQNAIASEVNAQNAGATSVNSNNAQNANGQSQGQASGNSNNGNQGSGNGNKSGSGQGQGSGTSGSGNGAGSGKGTGTDPGSGTGGGAGTQAGDRNLSIPSRIGGQGETTVDGGKLGEGTAAGEQQGAVPVTKGSVRPYEEVVGQYKDSYLQSTERLQLPKDLQQVVQTYFSSIEE